ncbi:hypothetical protein [Dyadobacter sp. 32]|uniref:hypothetical protein n=1 Tax=Dyadobacter sp. 32 TaxID=538966 RepID=UPI0011EBAAB2
MKTFLIALAFSIAGYLIFAVSSYYLVGLLSSNRQDKSVEASMTSIFVWGPIGLIIGFVIGFIWAKK